MLQYEYHKFSAVLLSIDARTEVCRWLFDRPNHLPDDVHALLSCAMKSPPGCWMLLPHELAHEHTFDVAADFPMRRHLQTNHVLMGKHTIGLSQQQIEAGSSYSRKRLTKLDRFVDVVNIFEAVCTWC